MGKITDALKKAAEERFSRIDKIDTREEVKYEYVAKKTVDSKIDPRIVAFYESDSQVSEQFRTLRTNIQAIDSKKPLRTLTISSSIHSEGKTITAVNLAVSMAQDLNKKKILLIDADLRRGRIARYLGVNADAGLAQVLSDGAKSEEAFLNIGINNLTVLPSGKPPKNPAELLGSTKFRNLLSLLKEKYDFVIIDSPPVISVTDAGLICPQTDGVIMVIQSGRTQKGVVKHAIGLLNQVQAKLLGYVLTNIQYHVPAYIYRYL